MTVCLGILGAAFRMQAETGTVAWIAVITLMAYVAFFAISLGPIFWLLIAEIYPLQIRGLAEGTAAASNWLFNLVVSITFLSLVQAFGPSWTFWLYGALSIAAFAFSYYMVPETKGRTLEEDGSAKTGEAFTSKRNSICACVAALCAMSAERRSSVIGSTASQFSGNLPFFSAIEVQNVVHQPHQPVAVSNRHLDHLALLLRPLVQRAALNGRDAPKRE